MANVGYIFQPHFLSKKFRVSLDNQQGKEWNFIVVTCSPSYNGVWKYDARKTKDYELWSNKGRTCVCVPIEDCTKIKTLYEIENPDILKKIEAQQEKWKNKRKSS